MNLKTQKHSSFFFSFMGHSAKNMMAYGLPYEDNTSHTRKHMSDELKKFFKKSGVVMIRYEKL